MSGSLHEWGADLTDPDAYGNTAVSLAACNGHSQCLKVLHDCGVDVNAVDVAGLTAVHRAAIEGHIGCLERLREWGADLTTPDLDGAKAIHQVAWSYEVDFFCLRRLHGWGVSGDVA